MTAVKNLDGRELVTFVMEYAGGRHVDLAEAYFSREEELSIEVRNGEVENLKIARDEGLGIRVIHRKRQGFAFTSDFSREAVENALDAALANARAADEDPCYVLPEPAAAYPDLELDDPRLREVTLEEKIEMARRMEDSGRAFDPRVRLTEQASYEEVRYETAIANSRGVLVSSGGSYCGCYVAFVAGEGGDQQTGFALSFKRRIAELDPAALGREAADKAVRMLGARRKPTKRLSVVLDPFVVASFLGMLSSALTAEAVQRGRSLFAGKMGEQVAAKGVTVIDDGALQDGILSAPCDGEGVPTRRTLLLDDGVLCSFLHNSYTAAKEGVSSTGNAVRGSFQSPPQLGSTNFYLEPGYPSPVQIIREMDEGLYVTEVMGMHTANPISGDFSLGVAGIWIEHGELTTPVRGMVIAGNILELLSRIDAVGSDLRFFGGKGAPSVRVSGLTVSGQ